MLRLMRNEYQKIFSKISTWVLIVLGLLLIVGIHLLFRSNGTNMDIQYSQFSKESIQQQKQYYRSQTSPDYQIELDLYDFIEENDLYTTKEFQLENSWMYLAINEAFYEKQRIISDRRGIPAVSHQRQHPAPLRQDRPPEAGIYGSGHRIPLLQHQAV